MNIVVKQVASSFLAANTLTNFSDKMKYKNARIHIFIINSQINVAVVYLLTCTWTIRYGSKRLPYMINEMFKLRNLREIWSWNSGTKRWEDSDLLEYDNLSRDSWFPMFRKQYVPSKRREPVTQWHIVVYKKIRILISVRRYRSKNITYVPRELIYNSLYFSLLLLLHNTQNSCFSFNNDKPHVHFHFMFRSKPLGITMSPSM